MHDDTTKGTPRDPHIDALNADWQAHVRTSEMREAEHHESLNRERTMFDDDVSRKKKHADMIEDVELDRVHAMRHLRAELDKEVIAAQDVAAKAFANLGLEYEPGKSKVEDLYRTGPLAESEAAELAGLPISCTINDKLLKILKFAGMIGCLLLGTIGMGALFFHIPPRDLFQSPMVVLALGLSLILVGGAYLMVSPTSRRVGAMVAARPQDRTTHVSRWAMGTLVGVTTVIVALVDAKALMAINAARAMADPDSAPSFALTFLVALALSASYVMGTCLLAFNEGYAEESRKRVEAAQIRHQRNYRERRQNTLEVSQAVEALNAVAVIEARRRTLNDEIKNVHAELRENLSETFADTGVPPQMPEEHRRDIRYHDLEARFAGQKLKAYETLQGKLSRFKTAKPTATEQDGAK